MLQYSCPENPPPWQRSLMVHRVPVSQTLLKPPCAHRCKTFSCLWQLCPSESWAWRQHSCLAYGDLGGAKCAGTQTASAAGVVALSEFLWAACSWQSKGLFDWSFSVALPIQALRGFPCLGSLCCSTHQAHRGAPLVGVLLCRSVHESLKGAPWVGSYSSSVRQAFDGPASLLFSCQCCCVGREAMVMAPPPTRDSCSITLLPWLPSFSPQAFPTRVSSFTSPWSVSPQSTAALAHSGVAPQSLNSSSQLLHLPGDLHLCIYGCGKDCLILIPFKLPQISCFPLSLKCFSSDSDSCPDVGIRPLLQFPYPLRAHPVLLTLLFFPLVPSSYQVLHGSIYSFLLVRSSCPLSAGVLHALLCLKVYPDVSMERDLLHIHLFLHHLVLPPTNAFWMYIMGQKLY